MKSSAKSELEAIFSPERVAWDEPTRTEYGKDWTKHITPHAQVVVFPKSTAEVAALVRWARKHKMPLVPSGGRTGLSGAAFATQGEVVVSFAKMNRILNFDPHDLTVTCEAGVITEQLQNFALEKGYYFPVDFASRGSSQIGGNLATNAGGIKVLRYGLFRQWAMGLKVVTGAGETLELNKGLVKNATGYDLRHLMIGSEGTLGFITEATLALTQKPRGELVFLFALPELAGVMQLFASLRQKTTLLAYEMFTDVALKYVRIHTGLNAPFVDSSPYYVIAEIEQDSEDAAERALNVFEAGLEAGWVSDGLQSQSPQQSRDFWRLREDISEATSAYKPYKNDISVRVAKVPEFLVEMSAILKREYPQFEVVWFGHIGDGNLHINILMPEGLTSEQFLSDCHRVDEILFTMIERFSGSVSAEHGVGLTKKPYLHHTRSATEIELMKSIKRIFDPDGIMNPGKIFDLN